MMLLAIETTGAVASVALSRDGEILAERENADQRRHSETVLPLVEELLSFCGVTLSDVDAFAVDVGPGSFTGVRIGVSTVNALAFALGKPVAGMDSLTVLAQSEAGNTGPVAALIDAGGGRAYAALFEDGSCILPPSAVDAAEFRNSLTSGTIVIEDRIPSARQLCAAALLHPERMQQSVSPIYLQPSQAERLYDERHRGERP